MLSITITPPPSWPLLAVLLGVLVLACLAWVLHTSALAIADADADPHGAAPTWRPSPSRRRPVTPPTSLRARMKARLACLRSGHDYTYTFRLGRPAHQCRRCGHWQPYEVVSSYRGGFRA